MRFTSVREDDVLTTLRENPEAHIVFPGRAYRDDDRILINRENRRVFLHRYLFEKLIHEIPRGVFLLRDCDSELCQNPYHYVGSAHPRGMKAIPDNAVANAVKTHCKNGHPFTAANTYTDRRGKRVCRPCNRARMADRRKES